MFREAKASIMDGVQALIAKLKMIFRPENEEKTEEKSKQKKAPDSFEPEKNNEQLIREAEYYQERMSRQFDFALYNPHFF